MIEIIRREAWEEVGFRISGPYPKKKTTHVVAHWPGSNSVPVGLQATLDWIARSQKVSLDKRGYSFYYNWVIPKGANCIIEVRGDDYNNAANAVDDNDLDNENDWTKSILIMVPVGQSWDEVQKDVFAEFVDQNYHGLSQMGHYHLEPTQCPGPLGKELPIYPDEVIPPIDLPEEEAVLVGYVRMKNTPAVYRQFSDGTKKWVKNEDELKVYAYIEGKTIEQMWASIKELPNEAWLRAAGVIVGPIPPNVDGWGVPK